MTPIEIAYFKHFMYDKGLEKSFLFYYRRNPIKGSPKGDKYANPESIEQFFLRTTVKDVIMKAFTFYPSGTAVKENSTFDYWKNIDDQWQDYMHSMASNFSNDSWPLLRKTFAILRQNWDIPGYWRKENFESTEEVYQRMHIDLPLPENCWEHGWHPKEHKEEKEETAIADIMDEHFDEALDDDVPEIDFVEFDKSRRVVNALTKGIMSVNTRNHSWRVTINRTDTKEIKKRQVKYAMVGNTKAGDTMLMLCNNNKGIPITYNTDDYYNVNSRQFCDHLKRLLSISDDFAYLRIEKVSEKIDSITYKVTKQ